MNSPYIIKKGWKFLGILYLKEVFRSNDENKAKEVLGNYLGNEIKIRIRVFIHTDADPRTLILHEYFRLRIKILKINLRWFTCLRVTNAEIQEPYLDRANHRVYAG